MFENEIKDSELFKSLKEAKGMRNIIAHQYGKIDDSIIFEALNGELEKDIKKFVKTILKSN